MSFITKFGFLLLRDYPFGSITKLKKKKEKNTRTQNRTATLPLIASVLFFIFLMYSFIDFFENFFAKMKKTIFTTNKSL
jgi:hypothetical protein